jgi:hypothetical protein
MEREREMTHAGWIRLDNRTRNQGRQTLLAICRPEMREKVTNKIWLNAQSRKTRLEYKKRKKKKKKMAADEEGKEEQVIGTDRKGTRRSNQSIKCDASSATIRRSNIIRDVIETAVQHTIGRHHTCN